MAASERVLRGRIWEHDKFLGEPRFEIESSDILAAADYMSNARIDSHPFFLDDIVTARSLQLWAEQELVISSSFSQALAAWVSTLDNCHIRAVCLPVLAGEHGRVVANRSATAHPALAEAMCRSIGTDLASIKILPATQQFIDQMNEAARDPMTGVGFLGVGNERFLIPEYTAVMHCFSRTLPSASYRAFLSANIEEDGWHNELMEDAGRGLISLGFDSAKYLTGARWGVDCRMVYLDELYKICQDPDELIGSLSTEIC
jgi:hypothetical protein